MERLYLAAKYHKDIVGQSAVARAMGVSAQVVKNWEGRGISESGALTAQATFNCDANWVLRGTSAEVKKPPPPLAGWNHEPTANVFVLNEPSKQELDPWPFTVSRNRFLALPVEIRQLVDIYMRGIVEGQTSPFKKTAGE